MFSLSNAVKANSEWAAQKFIIYGIQGLGKTTFGATFQNPILLRTEDGAKAINITTFPIAKTFDDVKQAITSLHQEKHDFKTLVVDSLDWLEPLVWDETCEENGFTNIESAGYGKGYVTADYYWRLLMKGFDSLAINKNMDIVLISHAEIKTFNSPISEPYDRYQLKLHKRAAGFWQEWADMVLFCNYKTNIETKKAGFDKEISRGTGSGERVVFTEERPAFHAKNRWSLPPEIYIGFDKTFTGFHKALSVATEGKYWPELMKKKITTKEDKKEQK